MYITVAPAFTQFAREMNLMYEFNLSIATESTLYDYIEVARNGAITSSASWCDTIDSRVGIVESSMEV